MHLVCSKSDLLKSVNISLRAVPNQTTMPILQCILIDAGTGAIKFTTNDMELGIETIVEGTILEKGVIAVDAKIFSDIIRKLPDNDVNIVSDSSLNVTITCEKAKFTIPGKTGDDFSYLPMIERSESISLSQFALKEIIRQTIFSIASNENNKLMTGELFDIRNGEMKVVSLDGHRISIRKVYLHDQQIECKVIVPGKTLGEISKILSGETDDKVNIFFTENHIMFEFDNTIMVSRLIEGEYFKIDQMLSTDYETKMVINKKELLNCIDRATLLVKEGDKKPIVIGIDDRSLELRIDTPMGSMDEKIEVEKEGRDILIGFNPKFLMDALKVIDDEYVTLYFVNAKAPCIIKNDTYLYLVLPVNFNSVR